MRQQQVNFTTFVLSLSAAALQNLGVPVEEAQSPCVNLALARQTIDVLEMLQTKTAGNLEEDEQRLLENILYDLRLRYVKAVKETGCPE
ncbi:MAG: DUF1844 domain-containing protein [Deltaproteobacteria bacterium]|nr:MAG: DUF1844 domain-containing protein [Deltaproteobacteria bacterium]